MAMLTSSEVLAYLGISTPSATQQVQVDRIVLGVIADIKAACRWAVDYATFTEILPRKNAFHDHRVFTAGPSYQGPFRHGRLQLSQMYVKTISNIYEDEGANGGEATGAFGTDTLLEQGVEYFLDVDEGSDSISWAGGVMRVDREWSSVPRSIKVEYTAGFGNTEYGDGGVASILREFALQRAVDRFLIQQSKQKAFIDGIGSTKDTSGLVSSERLGDYAIGLRNPLDTQNQVPMSGLTDADIEWLTMNKFVMWNIGV